MPQHKKYLGQHFLVSERYLRKIARAALPVSPTRRMRIVEIGPGTGNLTAFLPRAQLTLIEKDQDLIPRLSERFPDAELIHADFADVPLDRFGQPYTLVGNIPYYLTGVVWRKLLDAQNLPEQAVFTVQKEVGEKVTARAPRASFLSTALGALGTWGAVCEISRRYFRPQPRVDSLTVRFERKERFPFAERLAFVSFLRRGFAQPRKTLLNNLRGVPGARDELARRGMLRARPGEIELESWISLFHASA